MSKKLPEETQAGLDHLRAALKAQKMSMAQMAKNLQVSKQILEDFISGQTRMLGPDLLKALTHELFAGHFEWSASSGKLRPTNQAPVIPLGSAPAPFVPVNPPQFTAGPHTLYPPSTQTTPRPAKPAWLE